MPIQGGEKMTPAWTQRKEELLSDCIVSPDVFIPMVDRLRSLSGRISMPWRPKPAGTMFTSIYRVLCSQNIRMRYVIVTCTLH
jgi:hypothetical protein